jgi:hypothetical protein
MAEIQLFFKTVISKFFARDTACRELCDVCAALFDPSQNLHLRAFPAYQTPEAARANYALSRHRQRVEAERPWRLKLQVGDQVDAVKGTQVRGLLLQAWSRATVVYVGEPEDAEA